LLKIEALEIDDQILDKIEAKHGVTFSEVEEACMSGKPHVRKSKEGLYKIFSTTTSGRHLLVVLVNVADGIWKVVTARQMTNSERQLYMKSVGGK
jgi:uncharacterized DUF497 family protein